jgi:hypothetical protein
MMMMIYHRSRLGKPRLNSTGGPELTLDQSSRCPGLSSWGGLSWSTRGRPMSPCPFWSPDGQSMSWRSLFQSPALGLIPRIRFGRRHPVRWSGLTQSACERQSKCRRTARPDNLVQAGHKRCSRVCGYCATDIRSGEGEKKEEDIIIGWMCVLVLGGLRVDSRCTLHATRSTLHAPRCTLHVWRDDIQSTGRDAPVTTSPAGGSSGLCCSQYGARLARPLSRRLSRS